MALFVITFCVVQKTGEFTLLGSKNFISKCFAPIESHRVKMNEFNTQWIVKITLRKNSNYYLVLRSRANTKLVGQRFVFI